MSTKWLRLPSTTPVASVEGTAEALAQRRELRRQRQEQRAAERASMAMSCSRQPKPHSITSRPVPVPRAVAAAAVRAVAVSPEVARLRAELARAMAETDTGGSSLASLAWVARVKDEIGAAERAATQRAALDEALAAAERVMRLRRGSVSTGEDHPAYAQSLLDVAELQRQRGNPRRALLWLQKHAELKQRLHGAEHPAYAAAIFGVALLLDEMLDFEKALPLLVKAAEVQRRALGPDSPEHVATAGHLAALYEKIGRGGKGGQLGGGLRQRTAVAFGARTAALAATGGGREQADWGRTMTLNEHPLARQRRERCEMEETVLRDMAAARAAAAAAAAADDEEEGSDWAYEDDDDSDDDYRR